MSPKIKTKLMCQKHSSAYILYLFLTKMKYFLFSSCKCINIFAYQKRRKERGSEYNPKIEYNVAIFIDDQILFPLGGKFVPPLNILILVEDGPVAQIYKTRSHPELFSFSTLISLSSHKRL